MFPTVRFSFLTKANSIVPDSSKEREGKKRERDGVPRTEEFESSALLYLAAHAGKSAQLPFSPKTTRRTLSCPSVDIRITICKDLLTTAWKYRRHGISTAFSSPLIGVPPCRERGGIAGHVPARHGQTTGPTRGSQQERGSPRVSKR